MNKRLLIEAVVDCESEARSLTKNFTKKEGTITAYSEDDRDAVRAILRKHYKNVEVSDGRCSKDEDCSWVFSYDTPKSEVKDEALYEKMGSPLHIIDDDDIVLSPEESEEFLDSFV